MNREQVVAHVRQVLADLFELDVASISADSKVFEDLDLDSIDAIDLVASLQKWPPMDGQRIEEATMRGVRTVGDIADAVHGLIPGQPRPVA